MFNNLKPLYSLAQLEGRVVKLAKLIQLDEESLSRPDSFFNRHEKLQARVDKQYAELREAQKALDEFVGK